MLITQHVYKAMNGLHNISEWHNIHIYFVVIIPLSIMSFFSIITHYFIFTSHSVFFPDQHYNFPARENPEYERTNFMALSKNAPTGSGWFKLKVNKEFPKCVFLAAHTHYSPPPHSTPRRVLQGREGG